MVIFMDFSVDSLLIELRLDKLWNNFVFIFIRLNSIAYLNLEIMVKRLFKFFLIHQEKLQD